MSEPARQGPAAASAAAEPVLEIDDLKTQCRFAAKHGVKFPLVGDPDRRISRAYGVLWPLVSVDKRVTFVIDEQGIVRHRHDHRLGIDFESVDELRAVLDALSPATA